MSAARKSAATAPKRRASKPRKATGASKKNSLVANINRRRRAGKSRPKARSTVSKKAYADMKAGWPKSASKTSAKRAHA